MTTNLIKYLVDKYDGTLEGKRYGGGNQVVSNIIWISEYDEYVENFLNHMCAKMIVNKRLVKMCGENYRIIKAKDNARGFRTYQGYIDRRIEDEIIERTILPSMSLYCKEVKVF